MEINPCLHLCPQFLARVGFGPAAASLLRSLLPPQHCARVRINLVFRLLAQCASASASAGALQDCRACLLPIFFLLLSLPTKPYLQELAVSCFCAIGKGKGFFLAPAVRTRACLAMMAKRSQLACLKPCRASSPLFECAAQQ